MSHDANHKHHVTPIKTLALVLAALMALTILTVAASRVHMGFLNVPVAIGISIVKASLVITFFMALKWDNKVNALVLMIGAIFVVVFVAFTLFDTAFRGDLDNVDRLTIADQQRAEAMLVGEAPQGRTAHAAASEAGPIDGAALTQKFLCTSCHVFNAPTPMVGPGLGDVGSRLSPEKIRESLIDPDAVIAEGFPGGVMKPTLEGMGFYSNITDAEMDALVEYLSSLKGN